MLLNRVVGRRWLHTSRPTNIYKKKASHDYSANNLFKRGTPRKSAGSIQGFMKTAAYGKFGKVAPAVTAGHVGSEILKPGMTGDLTVNEEATGGVVVQYPVEIRRALSHFGSFKRDQHHEIFKERSTLLRPSVSSQISSVLEKGTTKSSADNRICLVGDRGVGKSTILAQAHGLAALNDYVVIPVPYGFELVSGKNDALYNDKFGFFAQPMYVRELMKRIAKGNAKVLKQMNVPKEEIALESAKYETHSPRMTENLYNFLLEGRRRRDAFVIMHEFLQILSLPSNITPVLFTLDDINVFCGRIYSRNRDTSNRPIYHGKLQVPGYFLQYLSGEKSFPRGAVITATSGKYRQNDTIPVGLKYEGAVPIAYAKKSDYDHELATKFEGVKPLVVDRYSQSESKTMLEFYRNCGLFAGQVTDEFAKERHLLCTGNARDLLRTCIEFAV